ncbi:MAG: xanthine dehydrogenase family protein subunit M [Thaumarchaeota archaeon]|nr:xanthine dehydrogenase family protein subunit M [Nitrososphaerota archaeon]
MAIKPFVYVAPRSIQEACSVINEHPEGAKVLAGGQSLLPLLKLNLTEVSYLVDLKRIPGLAQVSVGDDRLVVGALATLSDLARSETVLRTVPLLAETARGVGHPLVRNRGTIGGSLSHCDPASDICATALALDARITTARHDGERRFVEARDFFTGMFTNALGRGEILESVSIPIQPKGSGYSFRKLTMGHGDFPLIVVSVLMSMEGRSCAKAAIALGGVSDRPIRARDAEQLLNGVEDLRTEHIERAAAACAELSRPSSDLEVSAAYKRRMVEVFVRRALTEAVQRSRGAAEA